MYRSIEEIVEGIETGHNLSVIFTSQTGLDIELDRFPHPVRKKMSQFITKHGEPMDSIMKAVKLLSDNYDSVFIDGMLTTRLVKHFTCKSAIIKEGKAMPDTCLQRTEELVHLEQAINGFIASASFPHKPIYKRFKSK